MAFSLPAEGLAVVLVVEVVVVRVLARAAASVAEILPRRLGACFLRSLLIVSICGGVSFELVDRWEGGGGLGLG